MKKILDTNPHKGDGVTYPAEVALKWKRERDDARELAAMYLQCLNSRAMERGESLELIVKFVETEFAENEWLRVEYRRLADQEASVKSFVEAAGLIKRT
jgi:hypothetical protein